MPATVQDILNILDKIAPKSLAESWDNTGLMIGSPTNRINALVLGLDPTPDLLEQAVARQAELVITHHPIIFHPLHSLNTDTPDGNFIARAIKENINVISCHTNFDAASGGVSDTLAQGLGLTDIEPLFRNLDQQAGVGTGRIGTLQPPLNPVEFIERLKKTCNPSWLLSAGPRPNRIVRVALCGGSGSEFAVNARDAGAHVFVTAEVKHNVARWAEQAGLWVIDAGHFATEQPAMPALGERLRESLKAGGNDLEIWTINQHSPLETL